MDPMTYFIILVVSIGLQIALAPKPPKPPPASLEDFSIPTASEDKDIPVLFGTREIKDANIVWYGDLYTQAIKKKGGKK